MSDPRRQIPSIEKLLQSPRIRNAQSTLSHHAQVRIIQKLLKEIRSNFTTGLGVPEFASIESEVTRQFSLHQSESLKRVINATGIILHTNLGRAPLGKGLLLEMAEVLSGYSNLELDLASGARGSRTVQIERLLTTLTSAEAGLTVNNNAAALLLVLDALAKSAQVAISRGELVQIGGGFRVPEIIECSGAKLLEIGTTNITKMKDYERAIRSGASVILKVHQSNFHQKGHTESVSYQELGELCRRKRVPLIIDLGSGNLGATPIALPDQSIREALEAGADLICFSGDKLLGASQAGIVIGKTKYIKKLKKAPLYRALRLGKTEIFILERTLLDLINHKKPLTLQLIELPPDEIKIRAQRFCQRLGNNLKFKIVPGKSRIGGGSLPNHELPTHLIVISTPNSEKVAKRLRTGYPAVVCRINNKKLVLDLRTVQREEEDLLIRRLTECLDSD